jgi:hypothetical protein
VSLYNSPGIQKASSCLLEYVITYSSLDNDEVLGSSVTVSHPMVSIEHLPVITEDWMPEAHAGSNDAHTIVEGIKRSATLASTYTHATREGQSSGKPVQLFDGFRVEEFIVDDEGANDASQDESDEVHDASDHRNDASDQISVSPPESPLRLFDGKQIDAYLVEDSETSDRNQQARLTQSFPDITQASTGLHPYIEDGSEPDQTQYTQNHKVFLDNEVQDTDQDLHNAAQVLAPHNAHSVGSAQAPVTHEKLDEEDNLLSMLDSLKVPRMDQQYLEAYGTCISYVLHVWTDMPSLGKAAHLELLSRLEQSLPRAEMLRRACESDPADVPYDATTSQQSTEKGHTLKHLVLDSELGSLGDTVQDAMHALRKTRTLVDGATSPSLSGPDRQSAPVQQAYEVDFNEPKQTSSRGSTPPFLTWAWLSSGFEKSIPARRLAAENLFTIMEDIDRHLRRHDDDSYTRASKATLAELTSKIIDSQLQLPDVKKEWVIHTPPVDLTIGLDTMSESPTPLVSIQQGSLSGYALLPSQRVAIHAIMDEVATIAQKFVGLFIPCTYQHSVSNKIWGSLLSLLKVRSTSHS